MMFPFNRNDLLKVIDHGATWWRHWHNKELQQFNKKGPVIKVGTRSFRIHHERSDDSDKMFPRPGLNGYILVEERLRSRFWNNFLNRGASTDKQFRTAVNTHISAQTGWLSTVEAVLAAKDVKSVVEHTDIYRIFHVWVPGPGTPLVTNENEHYQTDLE